MNLTKRKQLIKTSNQVELNYAFFVLNGINCKHFLNLHGKIVLNLLMD